jgi:hypothetical protein
VASLTCGPKAGPVSDSAKRTRPAGEVEAAHVSGAVVRVENVEQRAVDDGVVSRVIAQSERIGDLEVGLDVAGRGVGPGLLDCPERGIHAVDVIAQRAEIDGVLSSSATDVKYLASDPPLALQSDYRRLRFPDHPRRAVGCIRVVEDRQRRCWSLWSRSHSLTVEAQAWFRSTVNPLASRTC